MASFIKKRKRTMMKNKIWPLTLTFIGLVTVSTAAFSADDGERTLTGSYMVSADTEITLNATVGTVEVSSSNGKTIDVELRLESDNDSWFSNSDELENVLIKNERDGNQLRLSAYPDDDMTQHWIISVPQANAIHINLGVGEIKGTLPFMNVALDLGVGDVSLQLADGHYGEVSASAGVGDTRLSHFGDTDNQRMIVTSESHYRGEGKVAVSAEVGVGDIALSKSH
jgi:hypothetical protein